MPSPDLGSQGPGQVVVLNGVPRSGKTSIARAMQEASDEQWLNLGVDTAADWLPDRLRPGIGLRPGGERPDLEDAVVLLFRGLFDAVSAHAQRGFNVVVDVGLHESYARPLPIVSESAERLREFPALFVGVHCSPDVIWQRRGETWGQHREAADESLLAAVARWPEAVHAFSYDLEVDTSASSPFDCAERVLGRLRDGPAGQAFRSLTHR
jgi:chloramphenicol 3-O phosphotransferase